MIFDGWLPKSAQEIIDTQDAHDYVGHTMAQAQPLNIPTASELTKAREFLCEAAILVSDVKSLLADSGNCAMGARC